MTQEDLDKFLGMIPDYRLITEDGHWLWIGSKNTKGYGQISSVDQTTTYKVHRLLLIIQGKLDPKSDLLALHKCNRRDCFNPEHLYAGTARDNMQDRIRDGNDTNLNKTHCKHGHEYTKENTYKTPLGKRMCKICIANSNLRFKNKRGVL